MHAPAVGRGMELPEDPQFAHMADQKPVPAPDEFMRLRLTAPEGEVRPANEFRNRQGKKLARGEPPRTGLGRDCGRQLSRRRIGLCRTTLALFHLGADARHEFVEVKLGCGAHGIW